MKKFKFCQISCIVSPLLIFMWVVGCAVAPEPELPINIQPEPEPKIIEKPSLAKVEVHEITRTSAIIMGEIKSSGGDSIISKGIIYRAINGTDVIINASSNENLYFMLSLSELEAGTEYLIKSFAENSVGKSYSEELSFKTEPYTVPELDINKMVATENVFETAVECIVSDDGGKIVIERGVCWSNAPAPIISDHKTVSQGGPSEYKTILKGLQGNTTYYLRGYAINELGISYTETVVIVVDIDGNVYNTIKIGNQRWTAENLKVTRLNNGVEIKNVTDNKEWFANNPKYCWYNNDERYKKDYGGLYNWYAASTGNLSPQGWRVPSHNDFVELITFLDSEVIKKVYPEVYDDYAQYTSLAIAKKIKAKYFSDNWSGSNEIGFSAIPAGMRQGGGSFDYLGVKGEKWNSSSSTAGYWSTSDIRETIAYWCFITSGPSGSGAVILWLGDKGYGLSIRCVMD